MGDNELEQGNILSEVRVGLASLADPDISLRSMWELVQLNGNGFPF